MSKVTGIDQHELDTIMKSDDFNKDSKITYWEAERVTSLPMPETH